MSVATLLVTACSGFLLAVLWMDLIFDAQVLVDRDPDGDLPEAVLASIAGYYRRAVTESRPMSRLIAVVMVVLLGALAFRVTEVTTRFGWWRCRLCTRGRRSCWR